MKLFHRYKIPIYLSKDNLLITYITINDTKLTALIDTGTNYSLINSTIADRCMPINEHELQGNLKTLLIDEEQPLIKAIELNFKINKYKFNNNFVKIKFDNLDILTEKFDIILGTDFLLYYKPLLAFKPKRK